MNNLFIPSHGIGEIYIDHADMRRAQSESSCFNKKKDIPLFKLLLDIASLVRRYY